MDVSLMALLSALAVSLFPAHILCPRVKEVVEAVALRNCSNGPPVRNHYHNVTIVQEKRDLNYIVADFKIDEPGTSPLKWKVLVYKCNRRDALIEQDDCEFFLKISRNDMCADAKMKNQIWTHFLDSSEPPLSCPLSKGIYKFSKITLDVEEVGKMAVGIPFVHNYYWVGRLLIHKRQKAWTCFEYAFKFNTVRV